jgi:hypothetical protein
MRQERDVQDQRRAHENGRHNVQGAALCPRYLNGTLHTLVPLLLTYYCPFQRNTSACVEACVEDGCSAFDELK